MCCAFANKQADYENNGFITFNFIGYVVAVCLCVRVRHTAYTVSYSLDIIISHFWQLGREREKERYVERERRGKN